MFQWLKKNFIPHTNNNHQPLFLRGKNTRNLIFIVLAVEVGVLLLPYVPISILFQNNFTAAVISSVLNDLTNQNRQADHLAVLTVNPLLNEVAQLKAEDMASKSYFSHTSPDGKAPWYWFKQVGYDYSYAGENLAVDFTDSQDVDTAWMNSPDHRANILKDEYTEVGTGIATGTYQGHSTIFIAQEFGKPANTKVDIVPVKVAAKTAPSSSFEEKATSNVLAASINDLASVTPAVVVTKTSYAPIVEAKINIFEEYLTSPRHIADIILIILAILVSIALLLKLFIRMDKRHPRLITNGLIVLALIFGVYVVNNYMTNAKMTTTTSFVSFQGDKFNN